MFQCFIFLHFLNFQSRFNRKPIVSTASNSHTLPIFPLSHHFSLLRVCLLFLILVSSTNFTFDFSIFSLFLFGSRENTGNGKKLL